MVGVAGGLHLAGAARTRGRCCGRCWVRVVWVLGALVVAVLAVLPMSRDFTSFMRNQHEARYLITPGNFIYGLVGQSTNRVRDVNAPREIVGADARMADMPRAAIHACWCWCIGETARAANFSLLGYARETNPELAQAECHRLQQRDLLRHVHRGVGAVHVLARSAAPTTTNAASAIPKACSTCWCAPATR